MEEKAKKIPTAALTSEDIEKRISLLTELLECNSHMVVSCYNTSGELLNTTAEDTTYDTMLRSTKKLDDAIGFGKSNTSPIIITNDYGLMWSVAFEPDKAGNLLHLHILGPVLTSPLTDEQTNQEIRKAKLQSADVRLFVSQIQNISVIPATEFIKDTLMLHYCITDQYLKPSDITFLSMSEEVPIGTKSRIASYADFWTLENTMVQFIKNGDIYYKSKIPSASSLLSVFQPLISDSLFEVRQMATIFCGLCIRAAIDGGISPDTVYTKSGIYLKNLSSAKALAEIIAVCHGIFEDLLFQVHRHQNKPKYSKEVTTCIDYIETHTEDPLTIDYLADRIGYSKYYMSKKFKAEVGLSVNSYIKKARIDKACYLIVTTNMDIEDISGRLHFGNRNFFTKVFKEETGTTPAEFRKAHKRY